ncbi:MAG TPA: glutamate racemase [Aestuariivirgaceae bacterium]|nr:glutamate racemase [Aestuariivirgaceae bacterium]
MTRPPRILLFDSGLGGLTVARAVRALLPDAHYLYGADVAAFPAGAWDEPLLIERIVAVMARLIAEARPDVVVVACNTASTLALARLREAFTVPFVGTVPAIKPAAQQTASRIIGVLATPGTVNREYTRALIDTYAFHCTVVLHGAPHLAALAEAKLMGAAPDPAAVRREIAPVFRRRNGRRTDTIVLGCTHYPLLLPELDAASPWPVRFIDPAPAIARRVASIVETLPARPLEAADRASPDGTVFLTAPGASSSLAVYAGQKFAFPVLVDVPGAAQSPLPPSPSLASSLTSTSNMRSPC